LCLRANEYRDNKKLGEFKGKVTAGEILKFALKQLPKITSNTKIEEVAKSTGMEGEVINENVENIDVGKDPSSSASLNHPLDSFPLIVCDCK
jgi:hypothetical protein